MSDQQVTEQGPQSKAKHPGGRPRKPNPAPPLPPPARYSLEETLLMGDQAAANATPAAQLRWISERVLLVKEIQARKDADRHDALEIANKRLQESIAEFERTQQSLENELRNKDRDLVAARNENGEMAAKLKELSDERAKQVGELTNNVRTTQRKAEGLLALVRCVCLQMEQHSEGQRIQYAARVMRFSEQALKKGQQLAVLVNNPEAHRKAYDDICWKAASGPIGQGRTSEQFAQVKRIQEEMLERSMQADREKLTFQFSNVVPEEVMNQAFKLLSVTREQVVKQLETERQEGKSEPTGIPTR
jgi:hypothetical protein